MKNKTRIDWCDYIWNPVWGCRNRCEYCYAKKIAKRFAIQIAERELQYIGNIRKHPGAYNKGELKKLETLYNDLYDFKPIWLQKNFERDFPIKSCRIFVNSMSDIAFWEEIWMQRIIEKIQKYPQHIFLFLTKFPQIYLKYDFPNNCWLGVTITIAEEITKRNLQIFFNHSIGFKFISFEPLLGMISFKDYIQPQWIIIGAQTNPYKAPKREWIEHIILEARADNIPVFLKGNLFKAYSNLPHLQEFPE